MPFWISFCSAMFSLGSWIAIDFYASRLRSEPQRSALIDSLDAICETVRREMAALALLIFGGTTLILVCEHRFLVPSPESTSIWLNYLEAIDWRRFVPFYGVTWVFSLVFVLAGGALALDHKLSGPHGAHTATTKGEDDILAQALLMLRYCAVFLSGFVLIAAYLDWWLAAGISAFFVAIPAGFSHRTAKKGSKQAANSVWVQITDGPFQIARNSSGGPQFIAWARYDADGVRTLDILLKFNAPLDNILRPGICKRLELIDKGRETAANLEVATVRCICQDEEVG